VTGDHGYHHVNDRPRNAPTRTGLGMGMVAFYGILWVAGANDVIADKFHVSLYATTWFFRFFIFIGPVLAFIITKRICLGLQRSDAASMDHGYESGTIVMSPDGEYTEVHKTPPVSEQDKLLSKIEPKPALPAVDDNGIPAKGSSGPLGHLRTKLAIWWGFDSIPVTDSHGHENGHGELTEGDDETHKELARP